MPPKVSAIVPPTPSQVVQRVLARFELGCPALRHLQVTVQVIGPRPEVVILPAAGRPRGSLELVFTRKGRLRTCAFPPRLGPSEQAAVEDLAWALHEALARGPSPLAPPAPPSQATPDA